MHVVAIDPGKHVCGYAVWEQHPEFGPAFHLTDAGIFVVGRSEYPIDPESPVALVYLEQMETRGGKLGNAADLLAVSTGGAFLAGMFRPERLIPFTPTQWKGQVPKDVHHPRILHALATLDPKGSAHLDDTLPTIPAKHRKEVLDAVGIGLYGLGLTHRGGVIRP